VNDATRAAQQKQHPATLRLPASFGYPLGGVIGRTAIGLALLALAGFLLRYDGIPAAIGGACAGLFGALVAASNLWALIRPARRRIVLDEAGVELRYGFSTRRYPFLEYSDYRISRIGLRRFLTALPIEADGALGERASRLRLTLHDRPAFLTPMPMMGDGAPATLLEWQSTLNELRRSAVGAAGLTAEFDRRSAEKRAEEARRGAVWRTKEQAGARPSRLSRAGFVRRRTLLGVVFFAVLLVPIALSYAVQHGIIVLCGPAGGATCPGIGPVVHQIAMIGGPALAIAIFVLGNGRLAVKRAHDLDLDLPYWKAVLGLLWRSRMLERRLSGEEGTVGTNRFGPPPN
jgi:hypothetical protein